MREATEPGDDLTVRDRVTGETRKLRMVRTVLQCPEQGDTPVLSREVLRVFQRQIDEYPVDGGSPLFYGRIKTDTNLPAIDMLGGDVVLTWQRKTIRQGKMPDAST